MQRLYAAIFFCLILCASAFPQDRGTIQCDPGSTGPVPCWTAPGSAHVVEQLSCGQTVDIVDLERGYFKIRLGNRFAYVYAKYVRLPQSQEQPTAPIERQGEKPQQPAPAASALPQNMPEKEEILESGLGVGFEVSKIAYEESSLSMQESGVMLGLYGDYTFRPNRFRFKLDGRFKLGDVDYSSPSGRFDDIRDYNFETRFTFGHDIKVSEKGYLTPFAGLGYRYLHDNLDSSGLGGYDRKSNYLYSPIGLESMFRLGSGWTLGLAGEYDLFWHGWQYSEFGDIYPGLNTLVNNQKNGWGTRGSVKIIKNLGKIDFAIEPFFRYWNIEKSDIQFLTYHGDPVDIGWEPANTSKEWGAKVGIRF